jgi:predicted aspartyl protease
MASWRSVSLILALLVYRLLFVPAAHAQPAFTDYAMPPSGQVTVPAKGGLTFQMKVNGQGPFATVFDTGAVNVVSANFAKQLGLKVEENPISFGAIGGGVKVHTTHIDTLSIGDLIVRNQTFYVLDIPSGMGIPQMLVGWEFLQRFAVRINFQRNELTFYDLPRFTYQGSGSAVPLILNKHGNGVYFDAKVKGIRGRFQLDSGNETGLFLNAAFVAKHHLPESLHATLRGYNGKGLGGDAPEAWFTRLHTLKLGSIVLRDPVVRLLTAKDSNLQELAGNIGQSTLKHFTVTVDCRRRVMYLQKLSNWDAHELFNRAGLIYDGQDGGDEVKTVFPGGPAEAAGLRRGDLITAINGIKPTGDANDPVYTQAVGTVLHLTVRRDGVEHAYDVTLAGVL